MFNSRTNRILFVKTKFHFHLNTMLRTRNRIRPLPTHFNNEDYFWFGGPLNSESYVNKIVPRVYCYERLCILTLITRRTSCVDSTSSTAFASIGAVGANRILKSFLNLWSTRVPFSYALSNSSNKDMFCWKQEQYERPLMQNLFKLDSQLLCKARC